MLGNSFLNSVHGKYAGVNSNSANGGIKLNSLGKYDLYDPNGTAVAAEYGSIFKGYTCWQSPTSTSPAKTKADGTEIKTKSDCEAIYGVGSWRSDTGVNTAGQAGYQGTCTTCHDVHNSLFVPSQSEAAVRKTCDDCHVNNATTGATDSGAPQVANFNHPTGTNTPFDTAKYESACVVCHMATQAEANGNQNSMPAHVWRINTDASYNTFPTVTQFYGGSCTVHAGAVQNAPYVPVVYLSDISSAQCTTTVGHAAGTWTAATMDRNAQTAPDGTYTKAVWVDLDMACGQCHGGSLGAGYTANAAPYFDKATLAGYAANMHLNNPTASFGWQVDPTGDYKVTLNGSSSTCPGSDTCTYSWSTGETGITASHTFPDSTPVAVTLTVSDTTTGGDSSITKTVTPQYMAATPTALTGVSVTPTGLSATANWTLAGGVAPYMVRVNWGDGTTNPVTQPLAGAGTLSHNYAAARTYTVSVYAIDSGVNGSNQTSATVTTSVTTVASSVTVSGLVSRLSGTPVSGASVSLKLNGVTKKLAYTDASGNYSFTVRVVDAVGAFATGAISATVSSALIPPAGLVGWWTGDGNATDIVGGRNGTFTNAGYYPTGKVAAA